MDVDLTKVPDPEFQAEALRRKQVKDALEAEKRREAAQERLRKRREALAKVVAPYGVPLERAEDLMVDVISFVEAWDW